LTLVVAQGIRRVATGGLVGLVGALLLTRVAARFLYGVSPSDPLSIGAAALLLLLAGSAAAAVPAWRAARTSPVESLRAE
jgi:putative ABC transport system permease protein